MLASFKNSIRNDIPLKPRILLLEVKDQNASDSPALAWLIVEREEIYQHDADMVKEATIQLSYQCIFEDTSSYHGHKGRFYGSYSQELNEVSLTSPSVCASGGVFLDLPGLEGQRIGTYLMNEIVTWAQQWPEANVSKMSLLDAHQDVSNKERRNRFYEQFGLKFIYHDVKQSAGDSLPVLVKELHLVETWKQNITEHDMLSYLNHLFEMNTQMMETLEASGVTQQQLTEQLNAIHAHPFKWLSQQLFTRFTDGMMQAIAVIVFMIAGILWIVI